MESDNFKEKFYIWKERKKKEVSKRESEPYFKWMSAGLGWGLLIFIGQILNIIDAGIRQRTLDSSEHWNGFSFLDDWRACYGIYNESN